MPSDWKSEKRVSVVVDTPGWFDPFAESLVAQLNARGHRAVFVTDYSQVEDSDVAFYLSCMRITPPSVLARSPWNLVVHASALPKGRGFSPIVWQVLEGASSIPITMIRMADAVDAGDIVMQDTITLAGHELNDELRTRLGAAIVEMCLAFCNRETAPEPVPQSGDPTWYARRYPRDSRLDPTQSLTAQFDLLRVVDNTRYPAFFDHRGHRYTLSIRDEGVTPEHED